MALIDDRIAQFKAEVGNRELTEEQMKIFNAFTKKRADEDFQCIHKKEWSCNLSKCY